MFQQIFLYIFLSLLNKNKILFQLDLKRQKITVHFETLKRNLKFYIVKNFQRSCKVIKNMKILLTKPNSEQFLKVSTQFYYSDYSVLRLFSIQLHSFIMANSLKIFNVVG